MNIYYYLEMGGYYRNFRDKTIFLKHKEKHFKSKSHMDLSDSINNKYCFKNLEHVEIEKILQRHVNN